MPETGEVRAPVTPEEWNAYFELRWRILRAPWSQPLGSERDEFEEVAVHRMICNSSATPLAIGRLHLPTPEIGQIRFMAVDQSYRRRGLGTRILQALEHAASGAGCHEIVLHARELSLPFYRKCGYELVAKSHLLYDEIQHFSMSKRLTG